MSALRKVGVTYRLPHKVKPYADALTRAGVEPILISPDQPWSIEGLDGLLLTGGSDLNPALYKQARHPTTDHVDDDRDRMESELLASALQTDLPVLAICRGMQLFNVAHGGTLNQHIEGHVLPERVEAHTVQVEEGTTLAEVIGPGTHSVNSRHHQTVAQLGPGLIISARSSTDGVIEGIERHDRRFAVGVQWHPEDLLETNTDSEKLFRAFAEQLQRSPT